MATPIGTNELNSLSRRYIYPVVVDNIYLSNLLFFRIIRRNKKLLQGGLQIEIPLNWSRFAAAGYYQGFDALNVAPSDTVLNAAWDWRQAYVPVTIDGLTLIRSDSPEAVVNMLQYQFEQAQVEMAEVLGIGVWSTITTGSKTIDGLVSAVDDGTVTTTYGGLSRSTYPFWKANYTNITPPLSMSAMMTMYGQCTSGGRHPTIIATTQNVYDLFWNLNIAGQAFPVQPNAVDEQLAQAGFTNLVFNGVPVAVDSHAPTASMYFLNEDYLTLFVNPRADFKMREFREPVNQDAMVALLLFAGNMTISNCARQGKLTGITS